LAEKLGENLALVLLPLGVVSFWLGAVGFRSFGVELSVSSQVHQWMLQGFGAVLCIAGLYAFLSRQSPNRRAAALSKDYGFDISFPNRDNNRVGLQVRMTGTMKEVPPDGVARVTRIVEEVLGDHSYHPKSLLSFDPKLKTWTADFRTGGKAGDRRVFYVVVPGESSRQLFEYYSRVGKETGRWLGLRDLPPDAKKCALVHVELAESSQ
jgi:hypothetical protein